jgi:hypothetical protein
MLDNSGMDCDNYSTTLFEWNANPSCPTTRTLGATGRTFGPAATASRNNLVLATGSGGRGWTISGDALNGGCTVILPIELLSFTANCNTNTTNLKWVTATQTHNDYFSMERSSDGVNYTVLGIIDGAGSSAKSLYYSFTDTTPPEGLSYYRLKQTDFDGQFKYSKIIVVKCENEILEVKIYPNPVSNELTIEMPGNTELENFEIISPTGAVIYKGSFTQKTTIQTAGFSNGMYLIKFSNNQIYNLKKLIKQ